MKYRPTPRDLFNPPPQAIDFGNGYALHEIQETIDELYTDYCHPDRMLFINILQVLEDHEKLTGVKP